LGTHLKIEEEQQKVFLNMKVVQNYFQETNKSLENVLQKEREAKAARTTFQKAFSSQQRKKSEGFINYPFQNSLKEMKYLKCAITKTM
jgi:hypothetical protein